MPILPINPRLQNEGERLEKPRIIKAWMKFTRSTRKQILHTE